MFSAVNGLLHAHGWVTYARRLPDSPYYFVWGVFAAAQVLAWACAVVFHVRETPLSERLDYLSVALLQTLW